MSKIDEFESLFKSASKPVFQIEPVTLKKVAIVIDGPENDREKYVERISSFLKVLNSVDSTVQVDVVNGESFSSVQQLLDIVDEKQIDLICTYRNLLSPVDFPFSLGQYVDVLTQATKIPVLLLPRPDELADGLLSNTDKVMLMTDHLAGDNRLVTYGALFTQDHGQLLLAHVEDAQTFTRYAQAISKIPDIDTDSAQALIKEQLLKEPADFANSVALGLKETGLPLEIEALITVGNHLSDYKQLVIEHNVDLLIMNTKDEDQLAMHGLAYPVSVELRNVPLLLI